MWHRKVLSPLTFLMFFLLLINPTASLAAPAAPTNLQAVAADDGSKITLTWAGRTDLTYHIYRSTDGVKFSKITGPAVSGTSYNDTKINPVTTYYYYLTSVNSQSEESPPGVTVSVKTPDTVKPGAPTGLIASSSGTQVTLAWKAGSDNVAVAGYNIYRKTGSGSYSIINSSLISSNSYTDTGLTPKTTYTYQVATVDSAGNASTARAQVTIITPGDSQAPSKPENLAAIVSPQQVDLTWKASSDNNGIKEYLVYRSTDNRSYAKIAETGSTGYTDTGVKVNVVYYYRVYARDVAGNLSQSSDIVKVTISSGEKTIDRGDNDYLEVPGIARVDVPSDALEKDTTFKIVTESFNNYRHTGYKTVAQPVKISAKAGNTTITGFNEDLTVTIYYNSAQADGSDVNRMGIYFWDEANHVWVPVPSAVHSADRRITAKSRRTGVFAILSDTNFRDRNEIPGWAWGFAARAVEKGIISGSILMAPLSRKSESPGKRWR